MVLFMCQLFQRSPAHTQRNVYLGWHMLLAQASTHILIRCMTLSIYQFHQLASIFLCPPRGPLNSILKSGLSWKFASEMASEAEKLSKLIGASQGIHFRLRFRPKIVRKLKFCSPDLKIRSSGRLELRISPSCTARRDECDGNNERPEKRAKSTENLEACFNIT